MRGPQKNLTSCECGASHHFAKFNSLSVHISIQRICLTFHKTTVIFSTFKIIFCRHKMNEWFSKFFLMNTIFWDRPTVQTRAPQAVVSQRLHHYHLTHSNSIDEGNNLQIENIPKQNLNKIPIQIFGSRYDHKRTGPPRPIRSAFKKCWFYTTIVNKKLIEKGPQ